MIKEDQQLIRELATLAGIEMEQSNSLDKMRERLAAFVDDLVANNFEGLISLLYRLDVSESKLKMMIAGNAGTNAGYIIADAIIKRQQEKIRARAAFSKKDDNIPEEEKW